MSSTTSSNAQTFVFPEVRVVEASAGSGKTYALAKRYIQLLHNPQLQFEQIPIKNILAITFTNKAAFEMKARILEFLKLTALDQLSDSQKEDIFSSSGSDHLTVQRKSYAIMEDVIHHYNYFQVQTIDKFINALLSGCAFKIGLTANFRIKTNYYEYLQYSLDELIDQSSKDIKIAKVFDYFLHNYLYLENRTGWFPKDDMLSIITSLFSQFNSYSKKFVTSSYQPEDIIKKKHSILEKMKKLKEILPEQTDKRFASILEQFLINHKNSFDIDSVSDYFAREFVPVKKTQKIPPLLEKTWNDIRAKLSEISEEEAFSLFNPYIQVFDLVMEEFHKIAAKDDVLFLSELNKKAGALFDADYVTVEELYYRLATRFHHYLIDEFQDTSRLQWMNLNKMVEEALSTGGSLFYVGDRKQAIYGFRGGEVELFDAIKEEYKAFNVQIDQLTRNWRSQKAIVEFNNKVFSIENLRNLISLKEKEEINKKKKNVVLFHEDDYQDLENIFGSSQQSYTPENRDGYVKVEYIDCDKKEERDEIIRDKCLNLIRELRKRFSYRNIAILTRSNAQVEQLTNWLLEEGILVESERTSNIKENSLIQEMIALLTFLNSPINNVAFCRFILGELFERASGIPNEEMHKFVFRLRNRLYSEKDLYIYTEFRKSYPDVWEDLIEEFFKNVGLYPLYEMVISIYHRFDCLRHFQGYQGYLMHFLELIKNQEEDHTDVFSFLEYFRLLEGEDLYIDIADSDAIKILTIHKSKGLEFPVVIIPFLGMDIQVGSSDKDQKRSYVMASLNSSMTLLRLKNKYLSYSEKLYALYCQEYKKSFFSELNNIYVALTRAQNEMYCFIISKMKNTSNIAKHLIPPDSYEQGKPKQYPQLSQISHAYQKLAISKYQNWINYLKDEFMDIDELSNYQQSLRGSRIHYALSMVGNLVQKSEEDVINQIDQIFQYQNLDQEQEGDLKLLMRNILINKTLKPFFHIQDGEVFCEKEVVNRYGLTSRIDRLIVKRDEFWVIDFKSTKQPTQRYEEQVGEYMSIVQKIYPEKEAKGYIIYLDQLKGEQVKQSP